MKQNLITDIIQGMLPYLNNAQSKRLQEVLQSAFVNYEITENTGNMKESERDFVEIFLAAKRIEGCSEKSLRYYKATIEAMLATLDKNVEYIVTDDIREYLTQYQQKNDVSKVTIDNIRRILSSFFSWLEDEDYILKNPVRRIHKVKTGTNIKETYSDEALELMRDNCQELRDLAIIPANSICVSCIGNIGYLGVTTEECITNQQINSIIVSDENSADFVYYYMKYLWPYFKNYEGQSTTLSILNKTQFSKIEVRKPDIDTQIAIASLLSSIDDKIEANEKINNNLEQQAQTLFKSWFIDAPESSSWETGTFSDIIETMIAGDWGKDSPTGNNTEMVYCIRGADIPDVKSGNKGKMPTRFILPKNYAAKHLVAGDVVVEISGGSPTQSTGRIASISQSLLDRYDKGMVCTNFCKAMKPKSGYSMFVYYYWQYLYDKKVFFLYENGTTGIKNLDISGFIETEPIILPPAELVEKFDAFCHSIFNVIFANGLQNEQLANMRDALLPKLMSGEVDVSELDL